jgi:hypothetical protein
LFHRRALDLRARTSRKFGQGARRNGGERRFQNLSFLVVGERAGSKLVKAKLLGVKVLTEAEFKEMLEGN